MRDIYKLYCIHMNRGVLQFCFIDIHNDEPTTNKLILSVEEIKRAISKSEYTLEGIDGLLDDVDSWVSNCDYTLIRIDGIKQEVYGEAITYLRNESLNGTQYIIWSNYNGELIRSKATDLLKIKQVCSISNIEIDAVPSDTYNIKSKDGGLNKVFKISREFNAHIYYKNSGMQRDNIKVSNTITKGFRYNKITKIFEIYDDIEKLDIYEEVNKYLHSGKIIIQLADDVVGKNQIKIKEFISTYNNKIALDIKIDIPKECKLYIEKFEVKNHLSIDTLDSNINIDDLLLSGDNSISIEGLNVSKVSNISVIKNNKEQSISIKDSFNNCNITGNINMDNIILTNSFNDSNVAIKFKCIWFIAKRSFNKSVYDSLVNTVKLECLGSFNKATLGDTRLTNVKVSDDRYNHGILYDNVTAINESFNNVDINEIILDNCYSVVESFNNIKVQAMGVLKDITSLDKSFNGLDKHESTVVIDSIKMTNSFNNSSKLEEVIIRGNVTVKYSFNDCKNLKAVKFETRHYVSLNDSFKGTQVNTLEVYELLELNYHIGCGDITLDVGGGKFGWYNRGLVADNIHVKNATAIAASSMGFVCNAELTIDNTVREIGYSAFAGAWIKKIDLWHLDKVKYIRSNTFEKCNVSIIVLPENIEKIEDKVFSGCTHLEHLVMPKNLKEINTNAFGDLLRDARRFSTNCYPNIYVFEGSLADKFFRRRRVPVVYIENIDDAYDIIYDRKNNSLKMAKLLLSNTKFAEYKTDNRFKNSLDVIYNLDKILNGTSNDDKNYITLPKYINIPVDYMNRLSKIIVNTSANSVNKQRFNIASAFLLKCTKPLNLSLEMYNNIKRFRYLGINIWYADSKDNNFIVVEEYSTHNKFGADGACFQIAMIIQSGILVYATILDKVNMDAYDKNIARYGSNNIFCFYGQLGGNIPYPKDGAQLSLLQLLKKGDILNKYAESCKISGKRIPDKLSNKAFEHFMNEMVLVYSEKVSRNNRKQTKAYFISTLTLQCIEAFIDIAGDHTQDIDNIKSIIINEIYNEIPKKLFKIVRDINNCEKIDFVFDCLYNGYDSVAYQHKNEPYQSMEYLAGKYLIAKNIKSIADISDISDLYIILNTGFCKEIKRDIKKLDDIKSNVKANYVIDGKSITISRVIYGRGDYSFNTSESNYILLISDGNTTKAYTLMQSIHMIITKLRSIGTDYNDIVKSNMESYDDYVYIGDLACTIEIDTQWATYKVGFHKVTKRVYLMLYDIFNNKLRTLLVFNDFKAMITEIERLNSDMDNDNKMTESLMVLRWAFNQNYSSRFYISDSMQDLWKLVAKRPKIEN